MWSPRTAATARPWSSRRTASAGCTSTSVARGGDTAASRPPGLEPRTGRLERTHAPRRDQPHVLGRHRRDVDAHALVDELRLRAAQRRRVLLREHEHDAPRRVVDAATDHREQSAVDPASSAETREHLEVVEHHDAAVAHVLQQPVHALAGVGDDRVARPHQDDRPPAQRSGVRRVLEPRRDERGERGAAGALRARPRARCVRHRARRRRGRRRPAGPPGRSRDARPRRTAHGWPTA